MRNLIGQKIFALAILAMASLLTASCASIDFDYPRVASTAVMDTADTALGMRVAALSVDRIPGQSGFYPLASGIDALGARLLLAERAERTIDTQYYLVKPDATGRAFLGALLHAADRGVRVRLLVDDVFALGKDRGMAALDAHPNFEIRVVNPFRRGRVGAVWSGLTDFSRVTRRMHAKSFTVDSQVTIVGGRNVADEYFGAREDARFSDLDVVGVGAVAQEAARMFDTYWNHETALPLPAFATMPDDPAAELERGRKDLTRAAEDLRESRFGGAVRTAVLDFIDGDAGRLEWAAWRLVYDSPDKHTAGKDGPDVAITTPLAKALLAARHELIILTPYFVPRDEGIRQLVQLQERGVQVTIVTNSLAANNHAAVHGDYAPARKPLLEAGVRIYEFRPDADVRGAEIAAEKDSRATLHTKAFFIDRETSFIGSFNFNQRSAHRDSESGVIIESTHMAKRWAAAVEASLSTHAWEVFLDERGRLRWRGFDDGRETIYTKDPESTWGQRFAAKIARILPIKDQL